MISASLSAILLASFLGSPHCAGMCGGFAAFYSGKTDRPVFSHIAYSTGRLCTYLVFGTAAGFAGKSLDIAGSLAGFQRISAVLMGLLLIYWGLRELFRLRRGADGTTAANRLLFQRVSGLLGRYLTEENNSNWVLRSFLIGLLSTFLPCGFLYGFVAVAAASGSPLSGILVMTVFWLGTLPVMLGVGGLTKVIASPLRRWVPQFTSLLLVAAGLFALSTHSRLLVAPAHEAAPHCPHHQR